MTEEERRIITEYVQRVAGAAPTAPSGGPWNSGRVPSTGQGAAPNLPPVDPEADRLIGELFSRHPEARYRLTQTAFVQEHALVQAQNRIQELEWELEGAQRQTQAASNRGFFGLGGSRPAPMPPRPQPVQAPGNVNPAMMGRQGPGFLGTAMMTAAGVAGGMVLGNMLMGAFGGGGAAAAATTGGGFGTEAVPTSSPWTDPGSASGDNDATAGGYDATPAGYDDASGGYDDAAGGYDDGDFGDEI
ncbi:DUF2076 domain-containing protein [Sabulicella glaciei]|uniref:DUF2076 domain-containing protein n=1 Tax=Sabulicella glaciei TaxID=2984948 RepID=A0ABT3NSE5_9PROT|nr:DUF2076 family protein [Roseococcus sp. MDT2-1-1]MCW8085091.1 DUF2076 domain-containing protein [Roseococcus sp. MDT2-1-1]